MEDQTKPDKEEMLKEINARMNELDEVKEVEEMIQDGMIEFDFEGKVYRVRKLARRERHEIKEVSHKEKQRLVFEKGAVDEEELIKMYLKKDNPVDIEALRQSINVLQQEIEKLATNLIECPIESDKEKIEAEALDVQMEQLEVIYKIDDCLNISVEKQLKSFVQEYMIYLCLEKRVDDTFKRVYESYDKFMDTNSEADDKLVYKATYYFSVLINKDD